MKRESDESDVGLETKNWQTRSKRIAKNAGRTSVLAAIGLYSGALCMNTLGQSEVEVGPVSAEVGLKLDYGQFDVIPGESSLGAPYPNSDTIDGQTVLDGGFLGNITADTHGFGPDIYIKPTNFELNAMTDSIVSGGKGDMTMEALQAGTTTVSNEARQDIANLIDDKGAIIGRSAATFAGGALLGIGLTSAATRRFRHETTPQINKKVFKLPGLDRTQLTATGASIALVAGSSAAGLASYNQEAAQEPIYHGLVAEAVPYVESVELLDNLDQETARKILGGFYAFAQILQQETAKQANLPPTEMRLMLVSDIHNRDVYPMLKNIIKQREIDAVIDSGDLTDFGVVQEALFATDPEETILRDAKVGIEGLDVGYYFVSGNHDSKEVAEAVDNLKSAEAVGPGEIITVEIGGLQVTLAGDPFHNLSEKTLPRPDEVATKFNQRLRKYLKQQAENGQVSDIVVTHDPEMLAGTGHYTKATINGHLHHPEVKYDQDSDTWNIQVGSTGGSGMRMALPGSEINPDTGLPQADSQSYTILELTADCQIKQLQVYELNPFSNQASVSTKINRQLKPVDQDNRRCA